MLELKRHPYSRLVLYQDDQGMFVIWHETQGETVAVHNRYRTAVRLFWALCGAK